MIEKGQEITSEIVDEFINGYDSMERIVNLEYSYRDNKIKVYYRNEKDQKCLHYDSYYPFAWAKRSVCQKMCEGNRAELKRLMNQYGISVKALDITDKEGNIQPDMNEGYCFLFSATHPMSQQDFESFFSKTGFPLRKKKKKGEKEETGKIDTNKDYLVMSPQEQYLISTGKRFFKGYDSYDDILRLIFDLETEGLDPKRHRINQLGVRLNRPVEKYPEGFERIFSVDGKTKAEKDAAELKVIDTMMRIIYTFKPDIITAHNGENFDWNFIIERCIQLGTSIDKVSSPYFDGRSIYKSSREQSLKLGGEVEKYFPTNVPGTIVTDSLHAVRRAQAVDSNMVRADLKYATKYAGIVKKNRVYTPGDKISDIWNDTEHQYAFNNTDGDWYIYDPTSNNGATSDFKKGKEEDKPFIMYTRNYLAEGYELVTGRYIVERYLLDDIWECDKVEARYNTTNFLICKLLPEPFGKCCTMGTAGQWKALLLAWCYENNIAVPKFTDRKSFTGGLSRLLKTGFVSNVVKLDYNSLYPSIILTWGIEDSKDTSGVMLKMLEYVLTQREKYKKEKRKANKIVEQLEPGFMSGTLSEADIDRYKQAKSDFANADKIQSQMKVLGNSFFGSFGAPNLFPFGSTVCAERTTCTGRQSLRLMISHFHDLGYEPIVGDTDGFNFKLPESNFDSSLLNRQNVLNENIEVRIRNKITNVEKVCKVSDLQNIENYEIFTSNGWKTPYSVKMM